MRGAGGNTRKVLPDRMMRIAQLAPPFERVPPAAYGGTEMVVANLTEALVRRGHEVTLFASGDSRTMARLVPTVDRALWHHPANYHNLDAFCVRTLGTLLRHLGEFDIVHNHMDYQAFPLARLAPCPVVTTLHGRLDLPELVPLYDEFYDVPLVSISIAQRRPLPNACWAGNVYHGLPLERYPFNAEPEGYLAFLGRISPDKQVDAAVRIARRTGLPLKIAARMPLSHAGYETKQDWHYYREVVKPLLGPGAEFIGEVAGAEKADFLGNARALLFPSNWPEPFGLVMIEALACGTPVVALDRGSVAEVVQDGVTGFICETEGAMAEAVRRLDEIDRNRCREEAARRFRDDGMAEQYERIYARLIAAKHTLREG